VVLPVFYVLAAGPLNWLAMKGYINAQGLFWRCAVAAYWPLEWAINNGGPIGAGLRRYLDLWTT
jgi:hypothetical protein